MRTVVSQKRTSSARRARRSLKTQQHVRLRALELSVVSRFDPLVMACHVAGGVTE